MNLSEEKLQHWLIQLADSNSVKQLEAAYALAQHGNFEGRSVFVNALRNEDPEIRLQAAEMLGQIGAIWALTPLGTLLEDNESYIRNEAIFALLGIGRPAVVSWLIKALRDEDEERREDARVALFQLLGNSVPTSEDFGKEDEDEAERVMQWWQKESTHFDPALCYYRGKPISLGDWITSLRTGSRAYLEWAAPRLHWWTGVDFGSTLSPEFAERWEQWWQQNNTLSQTGCRYFYGHVVKD